MIIWIVLVGFFAIAIGGFFIVSSYIEEGDILPLTLPLGILSLLEVYNIFFLPEDAPTLLYIILNIFSIFFIPTLALFVILVIKKIGIK